MLKATSSRTGGCRVEGDGSIQEQLNDLLNIIQSLHTSMLRIGEPAARMFRALLIAHLLPPRFQGLGVYERRGLHHCQAQRGW